jgi:hypothetical protein
MWLGFAVRINKGDQSAFNAKPELSKKLVKDLCNNKPPKD